jgi:hypothetical protein
MATSYNGWPASPDKGEIGVVQSEWFPGGAKAGDVTTVLRYVAEQIHHRVEGLVGGTCWGYSYRANANDPSSLSCHASGTAIDYNAPEHPNGVRGTWTDAQRGEIYKILDEVQGAVHWLDGVDGGTADEMHFEICVDAEALARIASELGGAPGPQPPTIGPDQMFALIQYNGRVYRWNGINRVHVPDETALGGDQIMLGVLGMDNTVWQVDAAWGDSYPEAANNRIYWNTNVIAQKVGVEPAHIA